MNERGLRARFIPWSEPATSTQQDRLRKCSLATLQHRTALTRTTQKRGQHDDQRKPESSRQEHQAGGIDGKSPTEMLEGFEEHCPWRKRFRRTIARKFYGVSRTLCTLNIKQRKTLGEGMVDERIFERI